MPRKFDRCVRKVRRRLKKRRVRGNPFAICNKSLLLQTTRNAGHRHKWMKGRKFTTISFITGRHKHRINLNKRIAMSSRRGGHTHRLLKRRK